MGFSSQHHSLITAIFLNPDKPLPVYTAPFLVFSVSLDPQIYMRIGTMSTFNYLNHLPTSEGCLSEDSHLNEQGSESDDEDTLSFCDLPRNDAVQEPHSSDPCVCSSSSSYLEEEDRLFEFVVTPPLISPSPEERRQTHSDFHSDRFSSRRAAIENAKQNAMNARLKHSSSVKSYQQQRATTKRVVMFGKAAIPLEMGLTDIRKRQNRRNPTPLFPAVDESSQVTSAGDERGNKGKQNRWGLFRILFRKASSSSKASSSGFGSAWARSSMSCISIV